MSKQIDFSSKIQGVDRDIQLLKELLDIKLREKNCLEQLVGEVEIEGRSETVAEPSSLFATGVIQHAVDPAPKKKIGRPLGSTSKKSASVEGSDISDDKEMEELGTHLETIALKTERPLKLEEFVKILRNNGFGGENKEFSKFVKKALMKLQRDGKLVQVDDETEERHYEHISKSMIEINL